MGHSNCEATAVEMEIYSKFKINNKILFQNYMKQKQALVISCGNNILQHEMSVAREN